MIPNREEPLKPTLTQLQMKSGDKRSFLSLLDSPIYCGLLEGSVRIENTILDPPIFLPNFNPLTSHEASFASFQLEVKSLRAIPSPEFKPFSITPTLSDDSRACYGMMVSTEDRECFDYLNQATMVIRHLTGQWWIGRRNPFSVSPVYSCVQKPLANTYEPVVPLRRIVGFEKPLTQALWESVPHMRRAPRYVRTSCSSFLDAVAEFMEGRDDNAILNLAFHFEICERAARERKQRTDISNNKILIKDSILLTSDEKLLMRELITDRDNVAHGKLPVWHKHGGSKIEDYIKLSFSLQQRFVEAVIQQEASGQ